MKKLFFTFLSVVACIGLSASNGFKVQYSEPDGQTMQLEFGLENITLDVVTIDGVTYQKISTQCPLHTEKPGWAELPYITTALQLADRKNYDLKFIGGEYTEFRLVEPLLPSRGVIYRDQDPASVPYVIDPESAIDRFYPGTETEMVDPYIIKDVRGTTVMAYPFQYNAAKKLLRVYHTMTIQLVENSEPAVNPLFNSQQAPLREMIGVYESAFINYEVPDEVTIADHGEILVITTARDESAIQPYIDWKTEKGYVVHKEVVATGTNVDDLVQSLYDANNNILFVLMVGDWADIKCANSGGTPQDPKTGCVVGTDDYFDICIGRLAANSADDVTTQVNKILTYEKEPDMGESWYEISTGVASNQGTGDDGEYDYEQVQVIFDDKLDPFTYDEHNGIYDPTATSAMVTAALETGTGIINYCGHGSSTSWGSSGFSNSDIANLTNGTKLPFIFSVACVNGAYHSTNCFAEAWMNQQGGGAVGTVMSTINQPWDPPMRGQDYFNDMIVGGYDYDAHPGQNGISTTEGRHSFGSIVFNGLVLMITESPGDLETANTWILFGDPAMQVRTATPSSLTYSNNVMLVGTIFETTVYKDGAPLEGAMVAISQGGETVSAVSDVSGFVSVANEFLPGDVQLVITGFNCETIYETIQCIPPTGPYVIFNSYEINDLNGNSNGVLEYFDGEVTLDFSMKNVGVENAVDVGVTISSTDPYVTITDNTENFGTIEAGASVLISEAFAFEVAGDVPEGHSIVFDVVAVGGETWESVCSIMAYSALLDYGTFEVDDSSGNNNGILDPGETADLIVTIANNGSADAFSVFGSLQSTDSHVIVNTADPQEYGDIAGNESATATYSVTAVTNIPGGYVADLQVNFTADYGFAGEATFGLLFPDYCYGEANCSWGDGITGFALEEIDNMNNGCSDDNGISGYGDFLDMSTTLDPGQTYTVSFETGYSSQYACLWIDLDDDKEFEDAERLVTDLDLSNSGQVYTADITIPADAPTGQKRLRVRAQWLNSAVDPCEDWSYGETEDYTVFIGEPMYMPPPENLSAQLTGNDVTLTWQEPQMRLELMGYNVYRDGEMLATMMTETTMTDDDCPEGSYWYAVTAVYAEGESGHCSPVQVTVGGFVGKIQGFVRDAITNQGIDNAWVSALEADFGAVTYETPFGTHYSLSLPGGTYGLICQAPGYQDAVVEQITVVDNGTRSINFYLYPEVDGEILTGIVDMDARAVVIYPNPATETVNLEVTAVSQVQMFSHTGQLVYDNKYPGDDLQIDLRQFEAGVYLVRIISGNHIYNEKLIVK